MHSLRYTWAPLEKNGSFENTVHQFALSGQLPIGRHTIVEATHYSRIADNGYFRNRSTVAPRIHITRAFEIAPMLVTSASSTERMQLLAGARHTVTFQEKTFSEFLIEQQVPFTSWENIRAQGRMSFLF